MFVIEKSVLFKHFLQQILISLLTIASCSFLAFIASKVLSENFYGPIGIVLVVFTLVGSTFPVAKRVNMIDYLPKRKAATFLTIVIGFFSTFLGINIYVAIFMAAI